MLSRRLTLLLVLLAVACEPSVPAFVSVLAPADTSDTLGPYRIEAYVDAPTGVKSLTCRWVTGDAAEDYAELAFERTGDDDAGPWVVELPGLPSGSVVVYYLVLVDEEGTLVRYPEGAPAVLAGFRVL